MAETKDMTEQQNVNELETNQTEETTTGTEATAPVSSVNETPTPEPVEPVVVEPNIVEAPTQEPVQPEVTIEPAPEVTVEQPVEEVKVTEPAAVETKQPETKVETVQDIQAKETSNEAQENQLNETKKNQVKTEMQQMIQNGSTAEEIVAFWQKNNQFKDDINTVLRGSFKNVSDIQYFGKYSTMSNDDMFAAYEKWEVVPWSEQYNKLPEQQRVRFEQYLNRKRAVNSSKRTDFTSSNNVLDMSELESAVPRMFSSNVRKNYEQALNNPQINSLRNELSNNQSQIDDIDDKLENLQDEIEERAWKWALISQLSSRYRKEYRELIRTKNTLLRQRQITVWEYQSLKSDAETQLKISMYEDGIAREQYNTELSLYETRRQEQFQLWLRRLERAETLEDRDLAIKLQKEQSEFEAKNREVAEQSKLQRDMTLLEFKAKLADDWIKWFYEKRDDWTYFFYNDETIPPKKVLDNINTPWVTVKTSFDWETPYTEVYDINNNWVWFNTKNTSLTWSEISLLNAPDWTRIPTRLNKKQLSANNPWGKECWEYVNDIMARSVWERIGSTWQSKLNYANETEWEIWSVAVWQVDPNNKEMSKWGHTGIIVWETSDKSNWIIKSSNIKGQWVVSVVKVPKSVISWYKSTNTIWVKKDFTTAQKQFLDKTNPEDFANKKEVKQTAQSLWLNSSQFYEYKAQNVDTFKKEEYKNALQLLDKMEKAGWGDWLSDAIWLFSFARRVWDDWEITFRPWTDAADFKAQYDALVDWLTLPNLDKMSGVLTDKDIELLKNASKWGLSLTMSEWDFKQAVKDLKGALNRAVQWKKLPEWQVIFTDNQWVQYDKQWVIELINERVSSWKWDNQRAKDFIRINNLPFKLK